MTPGSTAIAGPGSSPVVQPPAAPAASSSAPARVIRRAVILPLDPSFPAHGPLARDVEVLTVLAEGGGFLLQPRRDRVVGRDAVRLRVVAHVLGDLHRAEVRPAHRAEVRA